MRKISPNITNVISVATDTILTPAKVGSWLNLPPGIITKNTDLINDLINTTISVVENYSWLSLKRTTFEANFDLSSDSFTSFLNGDLKLSLERSPILSLSDITKIEYLNADGVYVEFDRGALTSEGLYENVTEAKEKRGWASILFRENVPFDIRLNTYKIKVTFVAGFTIDTNPVTDIPQALLQAILMIIASYYSNRGDCSDKQCSLNGYPVPCMAKGIIDQYSISSTVLGVSYETESCGWGL